MKKLKWVKALFFRSENEFNLNGDVVGASPPERLQLANHKKHGDALLEQGKLDEAAASYRLAIEQNSQDADAHLNLGFVLSEQKDYKAAECSLRKALEIDPATADAYYILGTISKAQDDRTGAIEHFTQALELKPAFDVVYADLSHLLFQTGQFERAKEIIQQGIDLYPENADFHYILGNLFSAENNYDQASNCFQKALTILPDSVPAQFGLGLVLHSQGRLEAAIASYRKVVLLQPGHSDAYSNLGLALREQGKPEAAIENYRHALLLKPDLASTHMNLGVALQSQGKLSEAIESYQKTLLLKPDYADALFNLGNSLLAKGELLHAIAYLQKALSVAPDFPDVSLSLGNAFKAQGKLELAVRSYQKALLLKRDYPEAHLNLGSVSQAQGMDASAIESYRKALLLKPDYAEAYSNIGSALKSQGYLDEALENFRRALQINTGLHSVRSNLLFVHHYLADQSAAELFAEARCYGRLVSQEAESYTFWHNAPDSDRCLRVGMVSGDLRQHPVGNFLEGVLAALKSEADGRLELYAYSSHFVVDQVTERLKAHCHGWHSAVGLSDEQLSRRIRDDAIDILIDLSGHTEHNRLPLFAWKPAPVQATWLGYLATTGVGAIDYLIADAWTLPETEEANFTEKIWRLPESYLCFTPPDAAIDVSPLPALNTGQVTFGGFNNLSKMNDSVVALWSRVLHAIPGSRLFLKAPQMKEASAQNRIVERFAAHGIEPDRLILEGPVPRAEYLVPFQRVDIALDPHPYPGITTSVENLWMGVPVLTLAGESFLSRQGVGLLMNAGLPEWIATDPDDYVARAVAHAGDLQRLAQLRSGLRQQVLASPIFDAQRFAGHFETALRGMWKKWCENHGETVGHSGTRPLGTNRVTIPVVNNVYVTVPASLEYMTTFVLSERNDWFEDEIRFVRSFVGRGMKVIDIGANYGLYTLSIAKIIGDTGKVWAFEPTESTAGYLSESISTNQFSNVELIRAGLSDRCGEAKFFTSPNSELNSLSQTATSGEAFETIQLFTLDSCSKQYEWDRIDFIKLDAEGEEVNILKGGQSFLSSTTPLVMYELKHGNSINLPLINSFKQMGYDSYRLLPSLNALIPFDQHQPFDAYLLNLFACKPARASQLEQDGVLVRQWEEGVEGNSASVDAFIGGSAFGSHLRNLMRLECSIDSNGYCKVVRTYLAAISTTGKSADKVGYLMTAVNGMLGLLAQGAQSVVRLITFSRVAFDAGERALGVNLLSTVVKSCSTRIDFEIDEPFLPATAKYDSVSPAGRLKEWLISSALEQYLEKHAFSVYFSRQESLQLFEALDRHGFMDQDMKRRHALLRSTLPQ